MVQWTQAELIAIITETLRMWGLATGFWRNTGTLTTTAGIALYDLNSLLQPAGILDYTVRDVDLLPLMCFQLCEPASTTTWNGSSQFSLAELVAELQRARNEFLDSTMTTLSQQSYLAPPGTGQVDLGDTTTAIRRAMWRAQNGQYSNLHWSDQLSAASYNQLYPLQPGTPRTYSILSSPPLAMQLIPTNDDTGTVELLTVLTGTDLDPTAGIVLGVPDDTTWIVRSLAMALLLEKDGEAADPARAQVYRQRYQMGMALTNQMAQVLFIEAEGVPIIPSPLAGLDYLYAAPHWQSARRGAPKNAGLIGGNMVGIQPVPDRAYQITFSVVAKAPIPPTLADPIQLGREDLAALLDGAESTAMLKLGAAMMDDAARLFQSFIAGCSRYNTKMSVWNKAEPSQQLSRQDENYRPERQPGRGVGTLLSPPEKQR